MAGYDRLYALLMEEVNQLSQEGRDIDCEKYRERINFSNEDKNLLMDIYSELCGLPMRADYEYIEPTELDEIYSESDINSLPDDKYTPVDRKYFRGAWLGRCIGCAFGQPVEGWASEKIIDWYKNAGKYPIDYFVPASSGENRNEGLATDEKICGMPLDDDTRFTVIHYLLVKNQGCDFDSWDVGSHWAWNLPFRFVCTAETQAYLNFINVDHFTPWYKPKDAMEALKRERVNSYLNPYREWIGAQIRCDAFAYLAAGMPKLAAKMSHTDAYFTHIKNGVYGEMFFGALIASAFTEKDVGKCLDIALSVIPKKSRFYEEAVLVRSLAESDMERDELIRTLVERGQKYSWVHTINNAAYCIAAILRYKDDFKNAVAFAVECGMDTDCNGATVGSFMGALLGEDGISPDLKDAMKDTFSVGVSPYDNYSISAFGDELKALHDQLHSK